MNSTYLKIRGRAGRISTNLLAVLLCLASVRSTPAQTTPPPSNTVPIRSIIPVAFDGSNGNITIGGTTLNGASNSFHLVALRRQPNRNHLDMPDVLVNSNFNSGDAAVAALTNISTQYPDAMIMVNTAGSYGFPVWSVGYKLVGDGSASNPGYGGTTELGAVAYVPLAFVGIVGLAPGTAPVSRWNSTRPVTGYLATDSNGNYTFIQTDFSVTTSAERRHHRGPENLYGGKFITWVNCNGSERVPPGDRGPRRPEYAVCEQHVLHRLIRRRDSALDRGPQHAAGEWSHRRDAARLSRQ